MKIIRHLFGKTPTASSILILFLGPLNATLAQDTKPPVLTGFSFSPTSVNTTTSPATVTVTLSATDDLSGVANVGTAFASPSGAQGASGGASVPISGTDLNGIYQFQLTIPALSEGGTWHIGNVMLLDKVGNIVWHMEGELQSLGFPTTLEVTSNPDTTPPVLTGFSFSPTSVNTSTGPATVTVTISATDNLSGVGNVATGFSSPSGTQYAGGGASVPISGTDLNGTYQFQLTIPALSESGTWHIGNLMLLDKVGNIVWHMEGELQSLGFPTTLEVTSTPDTTPPVLTGFSFTPTYVNTTTSPATVTVTLSASDNLSGVTNVSAVFASPSGAHSVGGGASVPISGTDLNGTYQFQLTIPALSESGTWHVANVLLSDKVGNKLWYMTGDLQALSLPTELIVNYAKSSQRITFNALPNEPYGTSPFTIYATASSHLPVSFASLTTRVCAVSGATVALVAAGQCTIHATQPGNDEWRVAPPVNQSFQVTKASQFITFNPLRNRPYGSAPFRVRATADSGLKVELASTTPTVCTVSSSMVTLVAVGTCTIQATQSGNIDYLPATPVTQSFEVTKAHQTITFNSLPNQVLGSSPFAVTATASSGLIVSFAATTPRICTVSGSTVTLLAVGTCTIRATQAGDENYFGALPVNQSFQVTGN